MIPQLLEKNEQFAKIAKGKKVVVFLDYDGTLTPIVSRPDLALLSEEGRKDIQDLSEKMPVAIISGRDRKDVENLVGIQNLIYAGSHGFDIKGRGYRFENEQAASFIEDIQQAADMLREELAAIEGAIVEKKRFAVASHYRLVKDKDLELFFEKVRKVQRRFPRLRKKEGKKVVELQPDVVWHKGKALEWLIERLGFSDERYLPIFIGDDATDEDAFSVLRGHGVGICVMHRPRDSFALFRLNNCEEVYRFLKELSVSG